jgi:hypothetical protein
MDIISFAACSSKNEPFQTNLSISNASKTDDVSSGAVASCLAWVYLKRTDYQAQGRNEGDVRWLPVIE